MTADGSKHTSTSASQPASKPAPQRQLSDADRLVAHFDLALKTLLPLKTRQPARPSPGAAQEETVLDQQARHHAAGLMRVNHTGEVCAQALYQGQSLTAKLPTVRDAMEQAAQEEEDHLCWCEERLTELDSRPSLLNPLWYGMSLGLGAAAGLAGDRWSLGFVAETERQVCRHLQDHLKRLPEEDTRSRAILARMQEDEARHEQNARHAGASELPRPLREGMTLMSRVMKSLAYRV